MIPIQQIVQGLIDLQENYAKTSRAIITRERYLGLIDSNILVDYDLNTEIIREPLLEHVGHIPMIASYLHQYIEHTNQVDLGRALIMLSIHDIGETEVGDVITYSKNNSHEDAERQAARELLSGSLFTYFKEFEATETLDAKFAYSVDSLAPIVHEFLLPELMLQKFEFHNFTFDDVIAKYRPRFEWDIVLVGIFDYLLGEMQKVQK